MVYNEVVERVGMTIDAAGVVVVVTGAAIAFVAGAVRRYRRESDVYRRLRRQLGQTILRRISDITRTCMPQCALLRGPGDWADRPRYR